MSDAMMDWFDVNASPICPEEGAPEPAARVSDPDWSDTAQEIFLKLYQLINERRDVVAAVLNAWDAHHYLKYRLSVRRQDPNKAIKRPLFCCFAIDKEHVRTLEGNITELGSNEAMLAHALTMPIIDVARQRGLPDEWALTTEGERWMCSNFRVHQCARGYSCRESICFFWHPTDPPGTAPPPGPTVPPAVPLPAAPLNPSAGLAALAPGLFGVDSSHLVASAGVVGGPVVDVPEPPTPTSSAVSAQTPFPAASVGNTSVSSAATTAPVGGTLSNGAPAIRCDHRLEENPEHHSWLDVMAVMVRWWENARRKQHNATRGGHHHNHHNHGSSSNSAAGGGGNSNASHKGSRSSGTSAPSGGRSVNTAASVPANSSCAPKLATTSSGVPTVVVGQVAVGSGGGGAGGGAPGAGLHGARRPPAGDRSAFHNGSGSANSRGGRTDANAVHYNHISNISSNNNNNIRIANGGSNDAILRLNYALQAKQQGMVNYV